MDAGAGNGDRPGLFVNFRFVGQRVLHSRNFGGNVNKKLYVGQLEGATVVGRKGFNFLDVLYPHE
jgi:hypothetical protein